jgi:hypothetical protein
MTAANAMTLGFLAFSLVAALTWFFSCHPRLFIRVFVPRDEWRHSIRGILRDPNFSRGMRVIALLQFAAAVVLGSVGLWLWLW